MGGGGGTSNLLAEVGDAFLAKISSNGATLIFSTYLGGAKDDLAAGLALDQNGSIWLTGLTLSSDFPVTQDAPQRAFRGSTEQALFVTGDAFVAQLDPMGRTLRFSTYLGGSANDWGASVGVDSTGAVYVTGGTSSNDFPVTPGAFQATYGGGPQVLVPLGDVFIVKYADPPPVPVVPVVSISSVASAASLQGASVAPGEIVNVNGSNIGPERFTEAAAANDALPTAVAETRVLFDDIPSPLLSVSGAQIKCIVPYAVAAKTTTQVVVEYRGIRSAAVTIPVVPAKPALFSVNGSGRGQGLILNEDFTPNSSDSTAGRGSVIQLLGTGQGQTDPPGVDGRIVRDILPQPVLPVTVTIGDIQAEVVYAGAPAEAVAGFFQLNVRIPDGVPDGDAAVVVFVGEARSQPALTVSVR